MSVAVDSALRLEPERPEDAAAALALIDAVFGPGRFAKAAERLREGNRRLRDLSYVARLDGRLVGSVRLWPVRIGGRDALLLGPIAVDPAARGRGLGATLVERACEAAAAAGHELVVLVGDEGFFGPLGFRQVSGGVVSLPGPADPRRVLVRELRPGAGEGLHGEVGLPQARPAR